MSNARCAGIALVAALLVLVLSCPGLTVASQSSPPHERALIFFNSLCVTCRADASKIKAWSERVRRKYAVLGVGFRMSDSDSQKFAKGLGWRFPVEGDPDGSIASSYHVTVPTEIVIINGSHQTLISYARWKAG